MEQKVSVLIPAFNEEKYIFDTVSALRGIPEIKEIIVIDDASGDLTGQKAAEAGAVVVTLSVNHGKGGALNKGLAYLTGDLIALLDGDLGSSASDVRRLILPVISGKVDMTIAKFPKAKRKGGFGFVKGLAANGIKFLAGIEVRAPLSGQRVLKREVVKALGGFESGYGVEVGMTIDAVRKGFCVQEIEVNMTHSETGRDLKGFFHRGKQFLHVAQVLAKRMALR